MTRQFCAAWERPSYRPADDCAGGRHTPARVTLRQNPGLKMQGDSFQTLRADVRAWNRMTFLTGSRWSCHVPPCSASCPTTQTTRSGFWSWRTAYLSPQTSGSHVFLLLLLRLKRAAARCRKSSVCVLQCLTLFTYQTDARQLGQLRFSSSVTTEIRQRTERAAMFVRSVWRLRDADIFKCAYFPLRTACLLSYGKKLHFKVCIITSLLL